MRPRSPGSSSRTLPNHRGAGGVCDLSVPNGLLRSPASLGRRVSDPLAAQEAQHFDLLVRSGRILGACASENSVPPDSQELVGQTSAHYRIWYHARPKPGLNRSAAQAPGLSLA